MKKTLIILILIFSFYQAKSQFTTSVSIGGGVNDIYAASFKNITWPLFVMYRFLDKSHLDNTEYNRRFCYSIGFQTEYQFNRKRSILIGLELMQKKYALKYKSSDYELEYKNDYLRIPLLYRRTYTNLIYQQIGLVANLNFGKLKLNYSERNNKLNYSVQYGLGYKLFENFEISAHAETDITPFIDTRIWNFSYWQYKAFQCQLTLNLTYYLFQQKTKTE